MRKSLYWGRLALVAVVATSTLAAIVSTTGDVVEIAAPASVDQGVLESNTEIRSFNEKQSFTLTSDLDVNISTPGMYDDTADLTPAVIPAGTVVDSHLLHLDPVGISTQVILAGSATFDADVIGVIVLDAELDASDAELGAVGTVYPVNDFRGLELDSNQDEVNLVMLATKTVTVQFDASNKVDQIRVITAAPPVPASSRWGVGVVSLFLLVALFVVGRWARAGVSGSGSA